MIYIRYNNRDNILKITFVIVLVWKLDVLDVRCIIQFFNIITHIHNDAYHHFQLTIWYEIFLPLNIWFIHLGDVQTDRATPIECISGVHDTIRIKIGTYL